MAKFHFQSFLLFLLTTPYYRSLRHSTLKPTDSIIQSSNVKDLKERLQRWFHRKDRELSFVNAGVCLTAPPIGCVISFYSLNEILGHNQCCFDSIDLQLAIDYRHGMVRPSPFLQQSRLGHHRPGGCNAGKHIAGRLSPELCLCVRSHATCQ